jgi:DNA invertase Pin-like site-specific DNA recombinase
LGRSTRELLDLIERIGKAGAAFQSLGDPLWDTSSSQGRPLSTLLAAIADFERDLIRERTGEGRKRAMAAGVKFGRKRKLSDYPADIEAMDGDKVHLVCSFVYAFAIVLTEFGIFDPYRTDQLPNLLNPIAKVKTRRG